MKQISQTIAALLVLTQVAASTYRPTVRTSGGQAFGSSLPASAGSKEVNQYLGLPFATARRWEKPDDFRGKYDHQPLNASMWGSACLQVLTQNQSYGSEDCLKANVWQPKDAHLGSKLPVMVFIYGGSNQFGEAEPYNMSALAAFHNVVAVNFNYRTGPIGWMAFEEDDSTGNWGILDIQSALRWVQREVANFGGDPTKVAIHGQSSGGGLVELQYVAPDSNRLFHAAISESGDLGAMSLARAINQTKRLAAQAGCLHSGKVNKGCMQALPALTVTGMTYADGADWGPIVDGYTIPTDPNTLLRKGLVNDCSVIFGAQTDDSFLFLSRDYTLNHDSQPNLHPDGDLYKMGTDEYLGLLKQEVKGYPELESEVVALYPPATIPPHQNGSIHNVQSLGRVESDQGHCSMRRRALALEKVGKGNAFVYRFNYWYQSNAKCTAVPNFHLPYLGAVHQDEVTFVMGQPNFMEQGSCCGKWGLSEGAEGCAKDSSCVACYDEAFGEGYAAYFNAKEFAFARRIGTMWTNFAASQNPNNRDEGAGVSIDDAVQWPGIADGGVVLDADVTGGVAVEKDLHQNPALCALWDKVSGSGK